MSSDKILKKSTFGGFKKEGVLNYIEELQAEILSLKKELNNSKSEQKEFDNLNNKAKQYESEISYLKAENIALKKEIIELKEINKTDKDELNKALESANNLQTKIDIYENKVAEIEKKFIEIENSYSAKTTEIDSKANVMMQDAVNYSEKIILKANETAKTSMLNADSAVKKAFTQITDAARTIKTARSEYDNSITALESSVENLSAVLSKITKDLNLTNETEA